jgi:hypothetical protein
MRARWFPVISLIGFAAGAYAGDVRMNFSAKPDASTKRVVAKYYKEEIADAEKLMPKQGSVDVAAVHVDLNMDGRKDVVARLGHLYFCGTRGCRTVALIAGPDGQWGRYCMSLPMTI